MQCTRNGIVSQFTYGCDGLMRKSRITRPGSPVDETHYLIDGQSVVMELQDPDQDGSLFDTMTGGGGTQLETGALKAKYLIGPRGVEYKEDSAGVKTWYVYDGLGSVIAEVGVPDANDNPVKAAACYDVYGNRNQLGGTTATRHHFCGSLGHSDFTADTGLVYMRARWYDPAIGRFISEDPAKDGANWYSYCAGNPVNAVDPDGKVALWLVIAGIFLVGAISGVVCYMLYQSGKHEAINTEDIIWSALIGGMTALASAAIMVIAPALGVFGSVCIGAIVAIAIAFCVYCGMDSYYDEKENDAAWDAVK